MPISRESGSATEAFRHAVVTHLTSLEARLVPVLRDLVSYPFAPEVACLHFEVFCDGFTEGFPVRAFFLDHSNNEHFIYRNGQPEYPCSIDPDLLQLAQVYPAELEVEAAAVQPEFDYFTVAGEALITWFARCWVAAGGRSFPRQATIALHDDPRSFDLVDQVWSAPS